MTADPHFGSRHEAEPWCVSTAPGQPPVIVTPVAGPGLNPVVGTPAGWSAAGERSSFSLPLIHVGSTLPAGWYEIRGTFGALGTEVDGSLSATLRVGYGEGADGDSEITLPDPDAGQLQALVLFKYNVTVLQLCPAQHGARFRLGAFQLRRLSRVDALRVMLGSSRNPVLEAWHFVRGTVESGLTQATRELFANYRRRVLPHGLDQYGNWVSRFDRITSQQVESLRARAHQLVSTGGGPLISILLPTFQTPVGLLQRCIESVQAQVYRNWQLCIADDASGDGPLVDLLEHYVSTDSRIELVRRERNGHISAASNTALSLARGEFVALLDHDDELRPHALLEIAAAVVTDRRRQVIYSDEDKIDLHGRRFDPYFKPDWDPDLLRSQNYLCHFTAIRTTLVREVGGFREGFEGSQDHDLFLRCTERLPSDQVHHIPKVLYHWRAIPGSTALMREAKDYASSAGARAVGDHLSRCHPHARVEELSHGHYRVRWPLPPAQPKVSAIIPTRDRVDLLRVCVQSILARSSYRNLEIVVVDNQSSDPDTLAYLETLGRGPRIRVLRYEAPFNYSRMCNWAVDQCDGEVVALINNDIEVISSDWLEEMVSHATRPDVGAVGAMLYYPDDTIQHAGVVLGVHGVAAHRYTGMPRGYPGHGGRARVVQRLSAVTGACLVVRRGLYQQVHGLDESLAVAFNDIDFCLRLREAGYHSIWTPFAELYHHESASRGAEDTEEKTQRFAGEVRLMVERWGDKLRNDPAYNVNLSLTSCNSALSVPPRHEHPHD